MKTNKRRDKITQLKPMGHKPRPIEFQIIIYMDKIAKKYMRKTLMTIL